MSAEDRRIRSLRPPLERPSRFDRPLDVLVEEERTPEGLVTSATVFLAGAECPFTCAFCDLWRYTTPGPTPVGALPAQLDVALASLPPGIEQLKLYNASNFFEPRAVPDGDREAILERVRPFARVVVESHPRLLGERAAWWAARLRGAVRLHGLPAPRLEVALGLETVHPRALAWLNKGAVAEDYDRAARRLGELGLGLRLFVLVGVPYADDREQVALVARAVERAAELGARVVSLVPVRSGNGELERLQAEGSWRPPTLGLFEECVDAAVEAASASGRPTVGRMVVQADPWDLGALAETAGCPVCASARVARLRRVNQLGSVPAAVDCAACEGAREGASWIPSTRPAR